MTDEDDILAAEFALGLLDPAEAEAVQRRARADGPLSLRIAWWRDQLAPLAREAEVPPPESVWPRIAAGIGANDNVPASAAPWKWATGGMTAIAAALLAVVVLRAPEPPVPPTPTPTAIPVPAAPLVASLSGARGMAVTVAYDAATARILVTPVSLDPGKGDAELWVIPVGQTVPVSMGVIDAKGARSHKVDAAHAKLLAPGATFAISQEAKGGSKTDLPQGAIVASGKIVRV